MILIRLSNLEDNDGDGVSACAAGYDDGDPLNMVHLSKIAMTVRTMIVMVWRIHRR